MLIAHVPLDMVAGEITRAVEALDQEERRVKDHTDGIEAGVRHQIVLVGDQLWLGSKFAIDWPFPFLFRNKRAGKRRRRNAGMIPCQ